MVEWLTGMDLEGGVQIDSPFDDAAVFGLVCQLIGYDLEGSLREIAAEAAGEEEGEKFDLLWAQISPVLEGGWGAVFAEFGSEMSGMKDILISIVLDIVIGQVVEVAVMRMAMMFNPIGALAGAIQTAWEMYQYIRDNTERIAAILSAFVDSMGEIVQGNAEGCAVLIEQALADSIPLAIDLLLVLLGMYDLGDRIKEGVLTMQDLVDMGLRTSFSLLLQVELDIAGAQVPEMGGGGGDGPARRDDGVDTESARPDDGADASQTGDADGRPVDGDDGLTLTDDDSVKKEEESEEDAVDAIWRYTEPFTDKEGTGHTLAFAKATAPGRCWSTEAASAGRSARAGPSTVSTLRTPRPRSARRERPRGGPCATRRPRRSSRSTPWPTRSRPSTAGCSTRCRSPCRPARSASARSAASSPRMCARRATVQASPTTADSLLPTPAAPKPAPAPVVRPEPKPAPRPQPAPVARPEPKPAPVPAPEPVAARTVPKPEPAVVPQPEPEPAAPTSPPMDFRGLWLGTGAKRGLKLTIRGQNVAQFSGTAELQQNDGNWRTLQISGTIGISMAPCPSEARTDVSPSTDAWQECAPMGDSPRRTAPPPRSGRSSTCRSRGQPRRC